MKRKEFIDLKSKDIKDLRRLATEKKRASTKAKMQISGGKEKNLKEYKNIRLEVAKILTLIREKEILEKLDK
jgi:ribosomal protein L29